MTTVNALFGAVAKGVVDAQCELDDLGRDSIDAFETDGVPPTVLAWSSVLLEVPVSLMLRPKRAAGRGAGADIDASGGGRLSLRLRYYLSPQGVDDPRPDLGAAKDER